MNVVPITYGGALKEIAALRRRNRELEQDKTNLLDVLNDTVTAIRGLNAILPDKSEAATR